MPQQESQLQGFSKAAQTSDSTIKSETLFLLSICRDEDDAAALRSDLRRSFLQNHKLQRCTNLDDASHLLQVCGFDLAFLRLDDFQNPQSVINQIKQYDSEIALVGMASGRLLASESFELPKGIDGHCRLEDLSPTLAGNLVSSVLEQKRDRKERLHLSQELHFAIESGELGTWSLDIETGRIQICDQAASQLGLIGNHDCTFLDDLIEIVYSEDQDRLKRLIDLSIETQGDLDTNFRTQLKEAPGSSIEIRAKYRPGGPREHPKLFGYLRRESNNEEEIQTRIQAANEAIQQALSLRDDAIQTASRELELLMSKIKLLQEAPIAQPFTEASPKTEYIQTPPQPPTDRSIQEAKADQTLPSSPDPANDSKTKEPIQPLVSPKEPKPTVAPSESLAIDEQQALQNVLKTITRQKKEQGANTFPFDFSAKEQSDYSEPTPAQDGFIGAAKRLVSITQNGHRISVTLSIENDGAIECERERELLFEILKELLTNVVKHAHAKECIIAVFRDEDEWVLQVEDDGVGLENNLVSISTPLNKFGLFRIRTKLALKGGQLDLTPTFPNGLIARARLPVSLSSRDAERA